MSDCLGSFKFLKVKFFDANYDLFTDFHVKQNRPVVQKEDKRHSIHFTLLFLLAQRLRVFNNQTLGIHPCFLPTNTHVKKGKCPLFLSQFTKENSQKYLETKKQIERMLTCMVVVPVSTYP